MSKLELMNSFLSFVLYLLQIGLLLYGNFIYFNLPLDVPALYHEDVGQAAATGEAGASAGSGSEEVTATTGGSGSIVSSSEINSERWLYVTLMSVLTIGYVHLMIFVALLVIIIIYTIGNCILG